MKNVVLRRVMKNPRKLKINSKSLSAFGEKVNENV